MFDDFLLPVNFRGEELMLPARLVQTGYAVRFEVETPAGQKLLYERDDAGEWRALMEEENIQQQRVPPAELLAAIAEAIEAIL